MDCDIVDSLFVPESMRYILDTHCSGLTRKPLCLCNPYYRATQHWNSLRGTPYVGPTDVTNNCLGLFGSRNEGISNKSQEHQIWNHFVSIFTISLFGDDLMGL